MCGQYGWIYYFPIVFVIVLFKWNIDSQNIKNSINKNCNIYKLEHAVFILNALLFFVREYISAIHRQTEFIKWCIVIHICQRKWEEMHFDEKTIRLYQVAILASSVDITFCLFGRYHLTWVHVTTYRYTMKISAR